MSDFSAHRDPQTKWLEELKAGDEVMRVYSHTGRNTFAKRKVDRVTATQIIVGSERFKRSGRGWLGTVIGRETWGPHITIEPIDAGKIAACELANRRRKILSTLNRYDSLDHVDAAGIEAIEKAIAK
jgi:hypothetical protein